MSKFLTLWIVLFAVSFFPVMADAVEPFNSVEWEKLSREERQKIWEHRKKAFEKKRAGREFILRLYHDWEKDRTNYEEIRTGFTGSKFELELDDIPDSAAIVALVKEQEDEFVRSTMQGWNYYWLYRDGPKFLIKPTISGWGPKKQMFFKDALGNPLSLATVRFVKTSGEKDTFVSAGNEYLLDEQGTTREPYLGFHKRGSCQIIVKHPYYGSNTFTERVASFKDEYRIPLLLADSDAFERSVRGVVLDDKNKPVPRTRIGCSFFLLSNGDRINSFNNNGVEVITDEDGWFYLYLPIEESIKVDNLIPPKSRYYVWVTPPKELGLIPFVGYVSNEKECVIKLDEPAYYHTFAFEDNNELITDPNILKYFHFSASREDKQRISYDYDDFKDGGMFPLGTYSVSVYGGVKPDKYERVEVTAQSPVEIVFKAIVPEAKDKTITYKGRVVHGITGKPLEGVFILIEPAEYKTTMDFADLTEQQWKALHKIGRNFPDDKNLEDAMRDFEIIYKDKPIDPEETGLSENDIALWPIMQMFPFEKGLRTDKDGKFEFTAKADVKIDYIIVFEQDYLGFEFLIDSYPYNLIEPDANGILELPPIQLFPAARVIVEPYLENENLLLACQWHFDPNNSPEWVRKSAPKYPGAVDLSDNDIIKMAQANKLQVQAHQPPPEHVTDAMFFLCMLYEVFVKDTYSFYGIPVKIQRPYYLAETYDTEEFENFNQDRYEQEAERQLEEEIYGLKTIEELGYKDRCRTFTYQKTLRLNQPQAIHVPAGANLTVLLYAYNDRDNNWAVMQLPDKFINLKQGQTLDLGRHEIKRSVQVYVKVLDSKGEPLEGIPVKNSPNDVTFKPTNISDKEGFAIFNMAPHSSGYFLIGEAREYPKLFKAIPYKIGGQEDAETEFTIQISDEIIQHIFNENE